MFRDRALSAHGGYGKDSPAQPRSTRSSSSGRFWTIPSIHCGGTTLLKFSQCFTHTSSSLRPR
jgi:hypothetical protein